MNLDLPFRLAMQDEEIAKSLGELVTEKKVFGNPIIGSFSYIPLKLWQLDGDSFLDGDNLNLLAFLPQMKLSHPQKQLQTAMERIATLNDKDHVAHLLYIMATLTREKGLQQMVDVFISKQEILEAPPFIRDAYLKAHQEGQQEGWQKGQQEGWQKGQQEGWQKGQQEGWQKGQQEGWRKGQQEGWQKGQQEGWQKGQEEGKTQGFLQGKVESILNLLRLRFVLKDFERKALRAIFLDMDNDALDRSLEKAVEVQNLDDMKTWLASFDA